jgi:hypothetical protein
MKRRTFIRTILAAVGSVVFSATGWVMGAGALTMPSCGAPCPPNNLGIYTPCIMSTCPGGGGCTALCDYNCTPDGTAQFWWGCTNQSAAPCSSGFCAYDESSGGCVTP